MALNRRKFITSSGLMAAGILAGTKAAKAMQHWNEITTPAARLKQFGLQLYSIRDVIPKDPAGILKQVAAFGYKQIESYEGGKGMFWGMTNKEFKQYMDDLGMTIISSHCDYKKDFERKAAEAGEIGMKHLICPYVGAQKTTDDYKRIADAFNTCGDICKKNGLRFGYHNHDYTFVEMNGVMPQDIFMLHTNPDTVDFQMDIYWVVTAGQDPVKWFDKYPNRFRTVHVKDRLKTATKEDHDASCDLGTGSIPYSTMLKKAAKKGVQYFVVEQERYDNSTPLQSALTDANYMKLVRI